MKIEATTKITIKLSKGQITPLFGSEFDVDIPDFCQLTFSVSQTARWSNTKNVGAHNGFLMKPDEVLAFDASWFTSRVFYFYSEMDTELTIGVIPSWY